MGEADDVTRPAASAAFFPPFVAWFRAVTRSFEGFPQAALVSCLFNDHLYFVVRSLSTWFPIIHLTKDHCPTGNILSMRGKNLCEAFLSEKIFNNPKPFQGSSAMFVDQ